jgi:tetratricopeptide (TPR) repeat protein
LISLILLAAMTTPDLDRVFERLYSFDFPASEELAARYVAAHREDPLGHAARAAVLLFGELNRLDALSSGLSGEKLKGKALAPDAAVRRAFDAAVGMSQRAAGGRLKMNPSDREALLAMAITHGLERDYLALIEKKLRQSMDSIREAHVYSTRLLAVDPTAYDAYLNTGFSEYLLGSFPAVLRWVVKIEGVEGDKAKGLRLLERAAQRGRYMKPFAQLLLAQFYKKEGKPKESVRVLRDLLRDHPGNAVIRREA